VILERENRPDVEIHENNGITEGFHTKREMISGGVFDVENYRVRLRCFAASYDALPPLRVKSRGAAVEWSRERDLNPQPPLYESGALPLSYLGLP